MNMKKFVFALTIACFSGFVGCEKPTATPPNVSPVANDDHDHDHSASQHDHSQPGHAHGVGPHDGTIADWGGGKFHAEFTVDHSQKQTTVYILGGDEKTPAPIDATTIELSIKEPEMQITLNAAPVDGDPSGKSSRFIGTHEKLGIVQEFAGTLTGVVEGTPYSGDFKEEPHSDHNHE
jgi:hypothetical protein